MEVRSYPPLIDTNRIERSGRQERAILVGVILPHRDVTPDDPLDELRGLAKTAGLLVVGSMLQKRQQIDIATYIGSGKVEELKNLGRGPGGRRGPFRQRPRSRADPQPREAARGQGGRSHRGDPGYLRDARPDARGPSSSRAGATGIRHAAAEANVDPPFAVQGGHRRPRALAKSSSRKTAGWSAHRIQELKAKLGKIQARKEREVASRSDVPTVSLVGYTNAGKSTLMNALTEAGVLVEDKLFATLDTRTRRWKFGGGGNALLSDTVGFIRDLPHALVASFKATLEEARQADLLLHVVDASSPEAERQIQAVKTVLAELGLENHPTLLVLNKADKVPDRSYLDVLKAHHSRIGRHQRGPERGARPPRIGCPRGSRPRALSRPKSKSASPTDAFWRISRSTPRSTTGPTTPTASALHCHLPRRCLEFLSENGVDVRANGQRLWAS